MGMICGLRCRKEKGYIRFQIIEGVVVIVFESIQGRKTRGRRGKWGVGPTTTQKPP